MARVLEESKALLVRRWGEMGGYWGINRTMAEIHALLFVSSDPLCTDDVMEQLHVSRGNASMNLRALVDWGLVHREHKLGDRKEYFRADTDVWRMFETIMRERRRREVEPIIATIERSRAMATEAPPGEDGAGRKQEYVRRLDELQNFLTTVGTLFDSVLRIGSDGVQQLADLLGQAAAAHENGEQLSTGEDGPRGPSRARKRSRRTAKS